MSLPRAPRILFKPKVPAKAMAIAAMNVTIVLHGCTRSLIHPGFCVEKLDILNLLGKSEETICAELVASGAVVFAEPDYRCEMAIVPNDPYYPEWFHAAMHLPDAWDINTGAPDVVVAILDTGVLATHPDLIDNMVLPGINSVDGSQNTEPIHPHGTNTAGIAAARGNNGVGIPGIAWNIGILPVRVCNPNPDPAGDPFAWVMNTVGGVVAAADWGAAHGKRMCINVSWGGIAASFSFDAACQYARERGALVFVSAGNDALDKTDIFPDFASMIAVGGINSQLQRWSGSTYGSFVKCAATAQATVPNISPEWITALGTSISAPIAAAVAALIWSVNPNFTPDEVEEILLSMCVPMPGAGLGHGRVDAGAAVAEAQRRSTTETVSIVLSAGWNPVSVPVTPTHASRTAVFPTNVCTAVWQYTNGVGYSAPVDITPKRGYWVKASQAVTLSISGVRPTNTGVDILTGWNLVGPVQDNAPPSGATTWGFSNGYYQALVCRTGQGYWVKSDTNQTIWATAPASRLSRKSSRGGQVVAEGLPAPPG